MPLHQRVILNTSKTLNTMTTHRVGTTIRTMVLTDTPIVVQTMLMQMECIERATQLSGNGLQSTRKRVLQSKKFLTVRQVITNALIIIGGFAQRAIPIAIIGNTSVRMATVAAGSMVDMASMTMVVEVTTMVTTTATKDMAMTITVTIM